MAAAVGVGVALSASSAAANGRFPTSVSVHFRPGNTADVYLGTTFGLLVSYDDGAGFHWVCEQNVGYAGTYDPTYRIDDAGTIYATTFDGLRISRDGGCSFETASESRPPNDPGVLPGIWVDALDLGTDGAVWVATAESGASNDVYRSTDRGVTFTPLGLASPVIWWRSLAVAPGQPRRAYVTGYQFRPADPDGKDLPPIVHLYRTDDAGSSWTPLPVTSFVLGAAPLLRVEAVAPGDGSLVFARSVGAAPVAGDRLYRSTDAGLTWTEVLATTDTIRGVVVRASDEVLVATITGGSRVSRDQGATFTPLPSAPQAACLGDRGDALFACGANWDPDFFSLGRSADATAWTKVFRFIDLRGPLSCPAGTVQHDHCEVVMWPSIREQFGLPSPADAGVDGPGPSGDSRGCCDAGGDATTTLGLATIVLFVVTGRVRARRRATRGEHGTRAFGP